MKIPRRFPSVITAVLVMGASVNAATAQTFTTLKHFTGNHGAAPYAGLTQSGSTLCGTTSSGGDLGYGTVFRVDSSIPLDQLGAAGSEQLGGHGLSVTATPGGARLTCAFQKLEGQATTNGLWLTSKADYVESERFRLVAVAVGRERTQRSFLPPSGQIAVADQLVRFIRAGLTEEYSVGVDGVRQDFVIAKRPKGKGDLLVDLALNGAWAEPTPHGATLTLEDSGRAIAYSRLRVTDATGRELLARMQVLSSEWLAILVQDEDATYPIRIDPTFSDADWVSLNPSGMPGANGDVNAIAVDGLGNVFVGGKFTFIGSTPANRVAKWDGNAWSALGSGIGGHDNASVNALAVSGTDLYVGGQWFTAAGGTPATNIAKWDGSAWSALGTGIGAGGGGVLALAVNGTNLYAGGDFTRAGPVTTANNIARWDGSDWSGLGSGMDDRVLALAVSGTNLYAGGWFYTAGVSDASGVARWDGSAWSGLGMGVDAWVNALAVSGSDLFVGGFFFSAGGMPADNIAKWDGSTWSALGSGLNSEVLALAVNGTNLYAGGYFTAAGATNVSYIARWDGSTWSDVGGGMSGRATDNPVFALAVNGTDLYAGGFFDAAGDVPVNRIAKWDSSSWSALGAGLDWSVEALAVSGSDLFVGGYFTVAGEVTNLNHIARWDGNSWSSLAAGMNDTVLALAVMGTNLYVGGAFTKAGEVSANHVARWDGTAWSALGSGVDGPVFALAVSETNLYVGGNTFTNAGGVPANRIAQWDGSSWSALGSGMNDWVLALAMSGSDLYAGGTFTSAGGVGANRVARWDGSSWSPVGSGIGGSGVFAIAVSGADIYAGGIFTSAGGMQATNIAKWDGSAWSALGSGMDATVESLVVVGTNLYAGGRFTAAGAVPNANYIARWDGSAWSRLGSGLGPVSPGTVVLDLASDGAGHLYVGGFFCLAGATVSPFIVQANLIPTIAGGRFTDLMFSPLTGFTATFSDATVGEPYRIQSSPAGAGPSWSDFTNFTYTGPVMINDPSVGSTSNKLFRAVTP